MALSDLRIRLTEGIETEICKVLINVFLKINYNFIIYQCETFLFILCYQTKYRNKSDTDVNITLQLSPVILPVEEHPLKLHAETLTSRTCK